MGTNITGIGNANAIGFKSRVTGGIYFPPELKDALVGVWSAYGKSNDSTDRNIIKNKIKDRGGDFVISNAAFKLNSGFGGFVEDFTSWDRIDSSTAEISNDGSKIKCINTTLNVQYLFNYINRDISSFKVKISNFTKGDITYYYRKEDGIEAFFKITPLSVVNSDKVIELPKSYNTVENGTGSRGGFYSSNINIGVTIEQIPSFEGAFVTDGIDDLITSTKTVQEMDITDEVTVVSMIHQIDLNSTYTIATTNYIENSNSREHVRSDVYNYGKTGIYGYSASLINNTKSDIKNILGDEADYYVKSTNSLQTIFDAKFSVVGRISELTEASQVAWYWTIIANKVLTTDQINQVIAYFNLDRTLNPDILCNITKQGITNDNHADFNDKLVDYSGNGRDIQMNNLAWKGGSGIAAKQYETFKDWLSESSSTSIIKQIDEFTRIVESTTNGYWVSRIRRDSDLDKVYDPINVYLYQDNNFLVHECKYEVDGVKHAIPINEPVGKGYHKLEMYTKDRYTKLPENAENVVLSEWYFPKSTKGSIKYSLIPSYKGGILLDGVNDFGKVTGMPIYKDYTIVVDYERISGVEQAWAEALISKSYIANQGAFVLMETNGMAKHSYSFGEHTTFNKDDSTRTLLYQSKYKCGDVGLNVGTRVDGDTLWLGTYRDNYSSFFNGVIYSLMSFPYSMSEFLIERQLKKHKLGTLYPDMVEFRPIVKSNSEYQVVDCYIDTFPAVVGNYYPINSKLRIAVTTKGEADEVISLTVNGVSLGTPSVNGNRFTFNSTLSDKSPQKINITIDEYIRYEDIVQPYPVIFQITDRNTNQRYSWGDKIKVGSSIQLSQGEKPNLLSGLYSIQSYEYEGKTYSYNQLTNLNIILTKQSISLSCNKIWLLDNNEPKCILSPRLLRIPNSSYKILGYIPDISGHGNNGVIHNSAYAKGSGVNEDGSYQFDGVDDFVTIPTTVGGKQVLMKVNWDTPNDSILYDQRGYNNEFAIYNGMNDSYNDPIPAYQGRNNGQTYIDGILNKNIKANELRAITHNITITNELSLGTNKTYPIIGSSKSNAYFVNMALYDFMLFDNISTDDKIKELNEYVGIEAKVELPPYYWDAYGKTNLDADKATIQQRGVAVGDYDLTNTNFAYDKMSGFGGYEFTKFDNTSEWINRNRKDGIEIIKKNGYSFTAKRIGTGQYFYDFQNRSTTVLNKSLTVKAVSNNNTYIRWEYKYRTAKKPDIDSTLLLVRQAMIPNVPITVALPYKTEQEKADLGVTEGSDSYLFYFDPSDIPVGEEYTVEMLPLYPNGLVYDGVVDYSENVNIPALTDYTYIFKRDILGFNPRSVSMHKGTSTNAGRAFTSDYDYRETNEVLAYSFGSNIATPNATSKKIIYGTKTSVDGQPITPGSNIDDAGLFIGKWYDDFFKKMVFYKLILYPKTIPLLQINFLKNLMERDEIIDLNNPIFIKNE